MAAQLLAAAPAGTPWVVAVVSILGVVAVMLKAWAVLRKVELEAANQKATIDADTDAGLRADMMAEIAGLRAELKAERTACDDRIERMEARHAADSSELKQDVRLLRHERNNIKMAMNFMVTSIKKIDLPELQVIAEDAEAMLARGDELIAIEKGARGR